jgi:hypothetical protein
LAIRASSWLRRSSGATTRRRVAELFDEEVVRLLFRRIGVKLTTKQADNIDVPVEGPYKPEHYRY